MHSRQQQRSPGRALEAPSARTLLISLGSVSLLPLLAGSARAAQTTMSISMAPPPATPQVLGPPAVAAKPGAPFLYTIAATGQAPLSFAATGLPAGLTIAPSTGTISGTTPAAGSYPITITVTNGAGSAQKIITVAADNTQAATPPMGWNSYDSFGGGVTEAEVIQQAQAVKTLLQPFGWNYVVIDFRWFDPEVVIDANGRYLPSPSRFPSATGSLGFKPIADRIHAMGLNFGIHIMRGIPRTAVSANSPILGSAFTASQAGNTSDACPWDSHMWGVRGDMPAGQAWYNSIFQQYAQWEIDFVKVDDMINNTVNPLVYHQSEVQAIRTAIEATGRSIVFSLSPGPMQTRDAVSLNANANMWRMVNDFWDTNGLSTLADVFTAAGNWQAQSIFTTGHWYDGDMLPLGYLGPRVPQHAAGPSALTRNEQVTVMTLWAMMPSPLIYGGNVAMLGSDAWTIALVNNDEVLAVDQDVDGKRGKRISQTGMQEIWTKDLSGGRKAVAFFNRADQDATMSATWAQLGVQATSSVRDVWQRAAVTVGSSGLSVNVPWRGAMLWVLSPAGTQTDDGGIALPDAGAGAVDAAGGAGGGGGAAGAGGGGNETGGAPNDADSGNGTTGGNAGSSGGTAGSVGAGGAGGAAGMMATGGQAPAGKSGCSCRIQSQRGSGAVGFGALVGLAALSRVRRKRRD
jgi:hypothetical protein